VIDVEYLSNFVLARAEAALSVVHAEYPWYPLRIHARLGVLLREAIVLILATKLLYIVARMV
jgi:hypothetical protein